MSFKISSRIAVGKTALVDVASEGLRATFQNRILPAAKQLSPREDKLPKGHTVHNADSIRVTVSQTVKGPKARMATHSGHGYYLETGTVKMAARPYLVPAFQSNIGNIAGDMKEIAVARYK